MHRFLQVAILVAVGAVGVVGIALAQNNAGLAGTNTAFNERAARACLYPSGGWAIINCSNAAAASSAALTQWSRYVVQCGDDSYFATGTAASGQDADSSDGWLPSGAWLEFLTTDSIRYLSCLNKNVDSDCRLLECQ